MRLLRVTIDDFGLIAHAEVEFAPGLTVFSGETGSGKTMLLGALRFALGERADGELIRTGALRARVVLEIEPDRGLRLRLSDAGFALAEDDDLIVSRELLAAGRSRARINGVAASAGQLRELAAAIVDVVGQHEAQRLLAPAFALDVLDRFGGAASEAARAAVARLYRELQVAREAAGALAADDGRALAQLEFARFAVAEIDRAAPGDREDERLRERRDVLTNAERILAALAGAGAALEGEGGALDALGSAAAAVGAVGRYGQTLSDLAASLGAMQSDVNELAARIVRESETVEADPAELDTIVARLETLDGLKKKYGGSLTAVGRTRAQFAELIEGETSREGRRAALEAEVAALDVRLGRAAGELTALRQAAARELAGRVEPELAALAMPSARFGVALEPLERIGPAGAEYAQLCFAPNPGEPTRPVAKSASGGELSRVLLAIIVAIADRRERTALIFDEIDAGIGGATAVAVGVRLGRLAGDAQVVVVTHLAPIATWADRHYALRKDDRRDASVIEVAPLLAPRARLEEIARMLSGDANPVSLEHAATLVAGTRPA